MKLRKNSLYIIEKNKLLGNKLIRRVQELYTKNT